jgi:hypothetical protein
MISGASRYVVGQNPSRIEGQFKKLARDLVQAAVL